MMLQNTGIQIEVMDVVEVQPNVFVVVFNTNQQVNPFLVGRFTPDQLENLASPTSFRTETLEVAHDIFNNLVVVNGGSTEDLV